MWPAHDKVLVLASKKNAAPSSSARFRGVQIGENHQASINMTKSSPGEPELIPDSVHLQEVSESGRYPTDDEAALDDDPSGARRYDLAKQAGQRGDAKAARFHLVAAATLEKNVDVDVVPDAAADLAWMFMFGVGGPVDEKRARHYLERAYHYGGLERAKLPLARVYHLGIGGEKNMEGALRLYDEIVASNTASEAMRRVATTLIDQLQCSDTELQTDSEDEDKDD